MPDVFLPCLNKDDDDDDDDITFCVKSYYILGYRVYYILRRKLLHLGYRVYYILRRKLLHFGLPSLLHFASKAITFWVIITFCVNYYILWRSTRYVPGLGGGGGGVVV